MNSKKGFTLAEVLITLGIIGIVAALTLPSLIQKHQKQVWVNQLKKSVAVWENGMKMMLADAETDDLTNTEFWQYLLQSSDREYACTTGDPHTTENNILKKYFKILNIQDTYKEDESICSFGDHPKAYVQLNGEPFGCQNCGAVSIHMTDGTLFGLLATYEFADGTVGTLDIDVNGENKGPNQWGRDTFTFHIYKNGTLKSDYWVTYEDLKEHPYECGNIETGDISDAIGVFCAVRIIHEGWKMNY